MITKTLEIDIPEDILDNYEIVGVGRLQEGDYFILCAANGFCVSLYPCAEPTNTLQVRLRKKVDFERALDAVISAIEELKKVPR